MCGNLEEVGLLDVYIASQLFRIICCLACPVFHMSPSSWGQYPVNRELPLVEPRDLS